jgi:iron(III) transport system substrate-binding protein
VFSLHDQHLDFLPKRKFQFNNNTKLKILKHWGYMNMNGAKLLRRLFVLFILVFVFSIGVACSEQSSNNMSTAEKAKEGQNETKKTEEPEKKVELTTVQDIAMYEGPDRYERLVEAAKKEGSLNLYTSMPVDSIQKVANSFEEKYGIKVNIWRASAVKVAQRTITEAQGNRFDADVIETNSTELEVLSKEALLQEVKSPHLNDLVQEAIAADRKWAGTRLNIMTQAYNTNKIKPEELPKTYEDLLDPKWKGRLTIESKSQEWFAMLAKQFGEEKGIQFFRDMVAQNGMSNRKGKGLLTEMVASGEVPFALTVYNYRVEQLKKDGAPIEWFAIEPAIARANGIGVANKAPHPNAAVLFYDYMLSDAQNMLVEMDMVPASTKVDTNLNKIKMVFVDPVTAVEESEKWFELFKEIFLQQQ